MSNTSQNLPASITLVGAGKMGSAMLSGWLAMGLSGSAITILEPAPHADLTATCQKHGIALNPPTSTWKAAEVLILAIKPQMLDAAAPSLAPLVSANTLIISILAGKRIADLAARLILALAAVLGLLLLKLGWLVEGRAALDEARRVVA